MKNLIMIIVALITCFGVMGCQLFEWIVPALMPSSNSGIADKLPAIPKITNWVIALSIGTIALSAVAVFNGSRAGIGGIIGGGIALVLGITVQRYADVIAFIGLAGGLGILVWNIWTKQVALRENVTALGAVNERVQILKSGGLVSHEDIQGLERDGNNLSVRTKKLCRKINGNNI